MKGGRDSMTRKRNCREKDKDEKNSKRCNRAQKSVKEYNNMTKMRS